MSGWAYKAELGEGVDDPDAGLLHEQCFFIMKSKIRSQALRTLLDLQPYQYHSEPCRNPPAAWDYCLKDETMLEGAEKISHGERPAPFKDKGMTEAERDTLHVAARDAVKRGADEEWFHETPDRRKFFRGTGHQVKRDALELVRPSQQPRDLEVYLFYGDTGLGKTAVIKAMAHLCEVDLWENPADDNPVGKSFPHYNRQIWALFDDFDGYANFRAFIRLIDRYERVVDKKYGNPIFRPIKIFITADNPPGPRPGTWEEVIDQDGNRIQQLIPDEHLGWKWGTDPNPANRHVLPEKCLQQFIRRVPFIYEFKGPVGTVNRPPMPNHSSRRQLGRVTLENGAVVEPVYPPLPALPLPLAAPPAAALDHAAPLDDVVEIGGRPVPVLQWLAAAAADEIAEHLQA
jgi:hypothetical protein